MKFTKIFKYLFTAMLMAIVFTGCGVENDKNKNLLNIATGNLSGTYYPIGQAIAEIINQNVSNVSADVQSTSGSIENITMLNEGQSQMAIVQNDIVYYAINGTDMFDKKIEHICGIASLYPETCQFVTAADSGINSIEDLRGKKVAVGSAKSGTEANARQILQAYGITYDDITAEFLSFSESAQNLKDGSIDAAFVTAGYPTASIEDVITQKNIRILSIDEDKISELTRNYPFYTRTIIPAGIYQGIDEQVQTVSVMAILVTTDKMDNDTGYNLTKAIFTNTDKLATSHKAARSIKGESGLAGMGFIQMNEGAEKFLRE